MRFPHGHSPFSLSQHAFRTAERLRFVFRDAIIPLLVQMHDQRTPAHVIATVACPLE